MRYCHPRGVSVFLKEIQMADMLKPSPALLCKLGSIVVHAEELLSPGGHEFDRAALQTLFGDAEVRAWIGAMDAAAMVPKKRDTAKVAP
jgi:hypothetical protein